MEPTVQGSTSTKLTRRHITAVYILLGGLWIVLSYNAIRSTINEPWVDSALRAAYVVASAGLIHYLMHRMDTARKRSERKYQNLIDVFKEPILVHVDGIIVEANPYARQMFGEGDGHFLVGMPILAIVHPDHREQVQSRIHHITANGQSAGSYEFTGVRLDGTEIFAVALGAPLPYQGKPAVQVMFRDVTAQVQAERSLRETHASFRLIEENMSDFITVISETGQILYSSTNSEIIFGEPLLKTGDGFSADYIHPNDIASLRTAFYNSLASGEPFSSEYRARHADGHWLWIELRGRPIPERDGVARSCVMVARDITDRRTTDEWLRTAERLHVIGELAAGVAHEIRNPLTIVRGFLQLQQMREDTPSRHVPMMLSELQRVETLIREFLLMAKPGQTELHEQDMVTLLRQTLSLLESQANLSNIRMVLQSEDDLPPVTCQEGHLKQVFINVLKNAMDAMPDGGEIVVDVRAALDNRIRIRITDEGTGIDPVVQASLGQPFFTTKAKGTGLGLTISQRIVLAHGGTFVLRDRADTRGAAADIVLPTSGVFLDLVEYSLV